MKTNSNWIKDVHYLNQKFHTFQSANMDSSDQRRIMYGHCLVTLSRETMELIVLHDESLQATKTFVNVCYKKIQIFLIAFLFLIYYSIELT